MIKLDKEIEYHIKHKTKFGDSIIIKAIERRIRRGKKYTNSYPIVRVRCKCGYEKNVYYSILKGMDKKKLICHNSFKITSNKDKVHKSYYNKFKYFKRWLLMNERCDESSSNYDNTQNRLYLEKGIKVCKQWKFYFSAKAHYHPNLNYSNYKNYEKFIDNLLNKFGYISEDLKNRSIRIVRIDRNEDFKPSNIGLKVKGVNEILH